jgi:hypothetical protein
MSSGGLPVKEMRERTLTGLEHWVERKLDFSPSSFDLLYRNVIYLFNIISALTSFHFEVMDGARIRNM